MNDLQKTYYDLNNSFKKKLVFHLGAEAGFFSEYNNMILAMLYCLDHKIKFVLYSEDANFGYKEGWNDYFLPFCDETKDKFHKKYNFRNHDYLQSELTRNDRLKIKLYKQLNRVDYLTQDLWLDIRNKSFENKIFQIPQLGINGDLRSACKVLIDMTWKYNSLISEKIEDLQNSLDLPPKYIGIHIRRGDKHTEQEEINISEYFDKVKDIENCNNAFVLTDDYTVISDIKRFYPDWNIYTLCRETERGYVHAEFQKADKEKIRDAHISLFASVDIISKAEYFIGTFGSNPGMYLGMRMNAYRCMSVDLDKWQIW